MAVDYDPRLPEVIADPYPTYRRLREEDPVHWSEILGGWVLTRYADVRSALLDRRQSADRIRAFAGQLTREARVGIEELLTGLGLWVVFTDPPVHTRLRGLLSAAFTSRAIDGLRPLIEELVERLLDCVAPAGRMDVIPDFAYPLPAAVIAGMIGAPTADLDRIKRWSDDLASFVGSALATPDKRERAQGAMVDLSAYFRALAGERRARPRQDLMSALLAAEARGDMLSEDEVIASCVLLMFAGHETTTNLIGNGLLALLRHPAERARLERAPDLVESAVEEFLRYDGPAQALARVALEDLEIDGRRVRSGDRLFVILNAADRDPAQFNDPERLDVGRPDNRHVAFGHGIHFCLGAPLARLEARIAFPALLRRLPGLALAADRLEWSDSFVLRGVRALPVTFRPTR